MRLTTQIVVAVLTTLVGGAVFELATVNRDITGRRLAAAQILIGVSPLVLYPWMPRWYGVVAGLSVAAAGSGYAAAWAYRTHRSPLPDDEPGDSRDH